VPLAAPIKSVLPAVPGYVVEDQRLSDDERRVAGMSDYVARVYRRGSVPAFTILVSYYERQTQGQTIHSPRNCLPGAGWEVLTAGTQVVNVDGVNRTLNRYVLKNGAATAVAFYWYQGRGRIVANEYTVKWNLLRDAAFAGHTEEALARVVVPVAEPSNSADPVEKQRLISEAGATGADISARLIREVTRVLPKAS
jgi:EpsI family protein